MCTVCSLPIELLGTPSQPQAFPLLLIEMADDEVKMEVAADGSSAGAVAVAVAVAGAGAGAGAGAVTTATTVTRSLHGHRCWW